MKNLLRVVALAAMLSVLGGCAGTMGESGPKITEADIQTLKKANTINTVYFKPVLFKSGWTRFTFVSDTPEPQPSEEVVKFKKSFINKTVGILKQGGISAVEVDENPGNVVFIEMRISMMEAFPFLLSSSTPVIAARWYVHHPLLKAPEPIYDWDFAADPLINMVRSSVGDPIDDGKVIGLVKKMVGHFMVFVGK